MKFKVGDKVRVREKKDLRQVTRTMDKQREQYAGEVLTITKILGGNYITEETEVWWTDDMLESITDPLADKIEERNNKQSIQDRLPEELEKILAYEPHDPIKPSHYKTGDKDLFDELYDRLYHSKKMFTGREVFIIVMKFVAERYTRRYPNKNAEDLSKGIYTLERLRGYEEEEE